MIFVTVGSAPFPRLVSMVHGVASDLNEDLLVQTAGGDTETELASVGFLEMDKFRAKVGEASLVIGHAGIGTIITALEAETPIIIVPRRARYGEHGDDHQVDTAKRFEREGLVAVARDEEDLRSTIQTAEYPTNTSTDGSLATYLVDHLEQL